MERVNDMASVKKYEYDDKAYRITVFIGTDSKGKLIRKTKIFYPTKTTEKAREKEAQQFADKWEREVKSERYLSGEKTSYREFAETWLSDYAEVNLSIASKENYWSLLERYVFDDIGSIKIGRITPIQCQKIVNKAKEKVCANSVKKIFVAMKSVFNYAYKMNIINENPCDRCVLPKVEKEDDELHFFTPDQADRFLNVALTQEYEFDVSEHTSKQRTTKEEMKVSGYKHKRRIDYQFVVLFNLAFYGGFRKGEILGLTWNDIDEENNVIRVRQAVSTTKSEGQIVKSPKTKTSKRDVVMPDFIFEMLNKLEEEQKQKMKELGSAWEGFRGKEFHNNFIFIQDNGKGMSVYTPSKKFKDIINWYNEGVPEEQKLPMIRFHDIRHTTATTLINQNVDIKTISHRLGHAQTSITLNVYGHFNSANDKTASDKLQQLFNGK